MIRYTIAIPEARIDEANAAMAAFTGDTADSYTFSAVNYQDAQGNLYSVCSGLYESQPISIEGQLTSTLGNGREAVTALGLSLVPVPEDMRLG